MQSGITAGKERFHTAARQYIALLSNHIHGEDNILYVMGDRVMTEEDPGSLCSRFCKAGCCSFRGKHREELEAMADDLVVVHFGEHRRPAGAKTSFSVTHRPEADAPRVKANHHRRLGGTLVGRMKRGRRQTFA